LIETSVQLEQHNKSSNNTYLEGFSFRPLYEQSSKVFGKRNKITLEKYLRIPTIRFLFRYHALLGIYFTGTEKSAFQAKLAKIGQFFYYNFAKNIKIEILNFDSSTIR